METFQDILRSSGRAAAEAAAQALGGSETESKGEDRKAEEVANTLRWPIFVGVGLMVLTLVIIIFKRR